MSVLPNYYYPSHTPVHDPNPNYWPQWWEMPRTYAPQGPTIEQAERIAKALERIVELLEKQ